MKKLIIESVDLIPADIPLTDTFVISQGKVPVAKNIFVKINLDNKISGLGEITPFPELSGADRQSCLSRAREITGWITGQNITNYKNLCGRIRENTSGHSPVLCGFETAILDALSHSLGIPLYHFFGGKLDGPFETDITIPILSFERSLKLAAQWHSRGFRKLKMKVGLDQDKELSLIRSLHSTYPDFRFIIDANQGFLPSDAIRFANELHKDGVPVIMFEQPVDRRDLDGLAQVRNSISFPVAADESVFTREELTSVISKKAADIINLKIMKTGLLNTIDIAIAAHVMGLQLMIGGMIETRVAMGCSLALVAGLGIIEHLDLDTPLLLSEDPVEGGYTYEGPKLFLSNGTGMDVKLKINRIPDSRLS